MLAESLIMAMTNKEKHAWFKRKYEAAGLEEVRGIYVKKEITAEVKEMLRELLAEKHEAAAFKRI